MTFRYDYGRLEAHELSQQEIESEKTVSSRSRDPLGSDASDCNIRG